MLLVFFLNLQMLLVGFGEEERPGQQNLRPIILAAA
jgi:hypothetical protein